MPVIISAGRGSQGAWQRFERGELALFPFYKAFGHDLSDTHNGNIWYQEYCKRSGIGKLILCLRTSNCFGVGVSYVFYAE
jgi:hypothetical protein